ncbi:hypothetical protein C8R47DRAFT_1199799 [Mycena vitilis]|nr:hypothetical protein C8R47DRAFT_1199799 [Mycena vitilis]
MYPYRCGGYLAPLDTREMIFGVTDELGSRTASRDELQPMTNRLNNITQCLKITAETLEILSSSFKDSSLEAITYTTQSLLTNIETIKQNKNMCIQLLEQTHELLKAILVIYIKSDTGGNLPPSVLGHIGRFTETLHKVHTFIEAQQKGSKIRRLFRQGELGNLLRGCKEGLCRKIPIRLIRPDTCIRPCQASAYQYQAVSDGFR